MLSIIISELSAEDPNGHTTFEHVICQQIVSYCQGIRVCLLVVDKLMATYSKELIPLNFFLFVVQPTSYFPLYSFNRNFWTRCY